MIALILIGVVELIIAIVLIIVYNFNFKCKHEWEVLQHGTINGEYQRPIGDYYIQKCKHCGKIKIKKLYV